MPQFRAKARAVDLLGKGQIADLPTAISELWKNGYDAYGDNLEAFLYMPDYTDYGKHLFVLTDDGKGMSNSEISDKWFVLGTDSKSRRQPDTYGEETLFKAPRVKMGEKGIGRLAVAYLGTQMLMLTKKKNNLLEAVFFDWRILENYDLFLEDIYIPSKAIETESSISAVFEQLKSEFLTNFPEVKPGQRDPWKDQAGLKKQITSECSSLSLPQFAIDEQIKNLVIDPLKTHSTRFVIFNPDQQILELPNFTKNDEKKDLKDDNSVNHTISALAALFNLFKQKDPEDKEEPTEEEKANDLELQNYKTNFWVINSAGKYDLLNFKAFFNRKDFKTSDHEISGSFDAIGNFKGHVRIYKKEIEHEFKPVRKQANSNFGPFELKLGYISGDKKETSINPEMYKKFEDKLELYGGLYV